MSSLWTPDGERPVGRAETTGAPEFHLFLPQMRMPMDVMVERARAASAQNSSGRSAPGARVRREERDAAGDLTRLDQLASRRFSISAKKVVVRPDRGRE